MIIQRTLRKGIAMIELIFAIVILGITMMSAPMLISQATSSSIVTFQQESIAITAAHTSALLTYAWDENNTVNTLAERDILSVPPSGFTDTELNATSAILGGLLPFTLRSNPLSPPSFPGARRRTFSPATNLVATVKIGTDTNDTDDDIDDFIENNLTLLQSSTNTNNVDAGEYMDSATITLINTVSYANDNTDYTQATIVDPDLTPIPIINKNSQALTNIKLLSVQLVSTSPSAELRDKNIVMNAFMCNIGSTTPRTQVSY